MQEKRSTLVTTRQRSSGKVMFSVLSVSQTVCSQGPHVITHGHVQPFLLGNHDPDPDTSAAPYPHGTPGPGPGPGRAIQACSLGKVGGWPITESSDVIISQN